jgi:hypothetical protein
MSDRPSVSPAVKQALEFGPLLVFLGVYLWLRDATVSLAGTEYAGFVVAVVAFVPLQIASALVLRRLYNRPLMTLLATWAVSLLAAGSGLTMSFPPTMVMMVSAMLVVIALLSGFLSLGVLKKSQPADLLR